MNPGTLDVQMATGLPLLTLLEPTSAPGRRHHIVVGTGGLFAFDIEHYDASYLTDEQIAAAASIAAAGPLMLWAIRDALNAIDAHERIDNPGEDSIAWEHHADHLKIAYRAATGEDWS